MLSSPSHFEKEDGEQRQTVFADLINPCKEFSMAQAGPDGFPEQDLGLPPLTGDLEQVILLYPQLLSGKTGLPVTEPWYNPKRALALGSLGLESLQFLALPSGRDILDSTDRGSLHASRKILEQHSTMVGQDLTAVFAARGVCSAAQSCRTLCNRMDYSPPGSSVHGIFQDGTFSFLSILVTLLGTPDFTSMPAGVAP